MVIDAKTVIIDGNKLKDMFAGSAGILEQKKKEIDALNVFPVPDGDTGTNMNLTFRSAAQATEKISTNRIYDVAAAASTGSLMGARGNSGVILSQIMRGIAKGLEGLQEANALQFANAMQAGVDAAYRAVMKPVEGTILTVSKETARGAYSKAKAGETNILAVLRAGQERGEAALARTPEMLPVLKQAGVVDAGGQGFLTILSGWIAVLEGKKIVPENNQPDESESKLVQNKTGITELENLEFPYCTEFLVKGNRLDPDQMKAHLLDQGDSLLVVGTEEVVKIHIHTKNPGKVLDFAVAYGSLHEVQIHNMLAQNEAAAHLNKNEGYEEATDQQATVPEQSVTPEPEIEAPLEKKRFGIVAVAMGEGIAEIFKSLGVDEVVYGGQTMNPSTSDLAEAATKVPAQHVFILPNNGNIFMAASQVQQIIQDQKITVIPSKSIPQAISSLVAFHPDESEVDNITAMTDSLTKVSSGEVTYAVRSSQFGELEIQEGDILGLVEDQITTTGKEILDVAQKVLENMHWREKDLVTVYYGKDMVEEDVQVLVDWLQEEKPNVEVETVSGKQPLYYYILGVE